MTSTDPYERFVERAADVPSPARSPVAKDRDRLIHSSALRRLQGKSQVFGAGKSDFLRTRLTHTLECAQIGRSLARRLTSADLDGVVQQQADLEDLVEAACLAHDLGHPPFGHNGEEELSRLCAFYGGGLFEGNAQSFRIVTFLEDKVFGAAASGGDRWAGLNLTRTTLKAICKYPYVEPGGTDGKFNVYDDSDDRAVFEWVWGGDTPSRTVATDAMDVADDIAYAVHDFEDGVWSGMIPLADLVSADENAVRSLSDVVLALDKKRAKRLFPRDDISGSLRQMLSPLQNAYWAAHEFDRSSRQSRSYLKAFTASLIGDFIQGAVKGRKTVDPDEVVQRRIALLKGIAWVWMIGRPDLKTWQFGQRHIVRDIFRGYWRSPDMLPRREDWHGIQTLTAPSGFRWPEKARLIRDHIAGMTDEYALRVHGEMYQGGRGLDIRLTY